MRRVLASGLIVVGLVGAVVVVPAAPAEAQVVEAETLIPPGLGFCFTAIGSRICSSILSAGHWAANHPIGAAVIVGAVGFGIGWAGADAVWCYVLDTDTVPSNASCAAPEVTVDVEGLAASEWLLGPPEGFVPYEVVGYSPVGAPAIAAPTDLVVFYLPTANAGDYCDPFVTGTVVHCSVFFFQDNTFQGELANYTFENFNPLFDEGQAWWTQPGSPGLCDVVHTFASANGPSVYVVGTGTPTSGCTVPPAVRPSGRPESDVIWTGFPSAGYRVLLRPGDSDEALDFEVEMESTLRCYNPETGVTRVVTEVVSGQPVGGTVTLPDTRCGPGEIPTGVTVDVLPDGGLSGPRLPVIVSPPSPVETIIPGVTPPINVPEYWPCVEGLVGGGTCELRVEIFAGGVWTTCTTDGACAGWFDYPSPTREQTFRCMWGPYLLAISSCQPLRDFYPEAPETPVLVPNPPIAPPVAPPVTPGDPPTVEFPGLTPFQQCVVDIFAFAEEWWEQLLGVPRMLGCVLVWAFVPRAELVEPLLEEMLETANERIPFGPAIDTMVMIQEAVEVFADAVGEGCGWEWTVDMSVWHSSAGPVSFEVIPCPTSWGSDGVQAAATTYSVTWWFFTIGALIAAFELVTGLYITPGSERGYQPELGER